MNGELSTELDVSIVIPAYNEEERLKKHIPAIQTHLAGKSFEIIVVNDGSRDGTATVASALPSSAHSRE